MTPCSKCLCHLKTVMHTLKSGQKLVVVCVTEVTELLELIDVLLLLLLLLINI